MQIKKVTNGLLIVFALLMVSLPGQAAMVSTAQMHSGVAAVVAGDIVEQRVWIRQQLILGGVAEADAVQRVAAMTDAQVAQLHQRIDQQPAGGNALAWLIVLLLVSEIAGWTDFIPAIRPAD